MLDGTRQTLTIQANKQRYLSSTDVTDHMRIRSPEAALTCTRFIVGLARKYKRREVGMHRRISHAHVEQDADEVITFECGVSLPSTGQGSLPQAREAEHAQRMGEGKAIVLPEAPLKPSSTGP